METAKITKTDLNPRTGNTTITVKCPYCKKTHLHGLGKVPETVHLNTLLSENTIKMSHCMYEPKLYQVVINDE